jgi:glutathione S-transferase
MLEECGARYALTRLEFGADMKSPGYLALNPMGKVPTLLHGDTVITETPAACATCHVYVDPDWLAATGERTEQEAEMLNFAENVESNSRLSCQIEVTPALDGLVVTMPESQH